jgi:hypothetical protein
MDRWKRFIDWCQQPSKVRIRNSNPRNFVILITLLIILVSSVTFGTWSIATTTQTMPPPLSPPLPAPELPTVESSYFPGVSAGDYVVYGDFKCNFSHPTGPDLDLSVCLCAMDWQKMEVIAVSGKEVVLRYTEQLKNGSASDHDGCVHVIEDIEHSSVINGTCKYWGYYFGSTVIAANLTEGDWLHSSGPCGMPWHLVNKTEVRTYLGVSRWVNILTNPNPPSVTNWIFDRESGVLLEYENIGPNNMRTSYRVVETNILSNPSASPASSVQGNMAQIIPSEAIYLSAGFFAVLISVATAIVFMKRRLRGGEKLDEGKVTFWN